MTRTRRILIGAAAAVVLLVAAIAGAAAFIPGERVARVVAGRAESTLGAPVRIGDVGLRLLPLPGVRLSGIEVGDSAAPVARVDEAELRARILPLFRGRVVISRLALRRPRVLLEIDSAGQLNLPLGQGGGAPSGEGRDVAFAVDGVSVESGRLGYRDLRDGTVIRLDGWDQSLALEGSVRSGRVETVALSGELAFDDVDARLPDVVLPLRDLRLTLTHDATLDRAADRLDVRSLELTVNGITLAGSGRIDSVSTTARSAALRLAARDVDAAGLLAWVPDSLRAKLALPDGRPLDLAGVLGVEATVEGPLTADTRPDVRGTFTVSDLTVGAGDPILSAASARGSFALDSVDARLEGRLLGGPIEATLALGRPEAPVAVTALRGRIDLESLAALGIADTLGLRGALAVDLGTRVPTDDPARSTVAGTLGLAGLEATGVEPTVHVADGTVRFDGAGLASGPVRMELGPDRVPVLLTLAVQRWIPTLVDPEAPPPTIELALEADTLDLDDLLGPKESDYPAVLFARLRDRPLDGRSAAEVAEEMGLALPSLPPVDGRATASIVLLRRNGLQYRNLEAQLRLGTHAVDVERLRFGFMGGTVQLTGRLEPMAPDSGGRATEARLVGQYSLAGVGAERFFDRLTPFRDHLAGSLDLAGSVDMRLDRHALPDREAVRADGTLAMAEGRLANWRVLEALGERLGVATFDTIRFQDWVGSYAVTGPLVTLEETVLQGRRLDARAAGSFDLGGRLDLGATLYLTRELAERAGSIGREVLAAAATDDRVPVGLRIRGDVEQPDVSLDLSEARSAVVARAREAAESAAREQAREIADRATRETAERLQLPDSLKGLPADSLRAVLGDSLFSLLPDSVKLADDSLRTSAEDALKARLRRLLGGGGGGGSP